MTGCACILRMISMSLRASAVVPRKAAACPSAVSTLRALSADAASCLASSSAASASLMHAVSYRVVLTSSVYAHSFQAACISIPVERPLGLALDVHLLGARERLHRFQHLRRTLARDGTLARDAGHIRGCRSARHALGAGGCPHITGPSPATTQGYKTTPSAPEQPSGPLWLILQGSFVRRLFCCSSAAHSPGAATTSAVSSSEANTSCVHQ